MRVSRVGMRATVAFCLFAVAAVLGACGGSDSDDSGSGKLGGTVSINQSGGDYTDIARKSWWGPLEDETGLRVKDSAPANFTKLKAQVDSGNVIWDMAELTTGGEYLQAKEQGLIQKLDRKKLQKYLTRFGGGDLDKDFVEGSIESHGTWFSPYATILIFDKREFPDSGPQPTSLADLWDFDKFPGKRCFSSAALYSLEIALAADGVSKDDMYPLDVDAAFDKLDELKPEVAKFWTEGAEPIQLVSDGECVMSTVWNGRPFAAAVSEGIDYLGVAWDGGILHTSRWGIPKGAPNTEGAYAALAYYLTPKVGVAIGNAIGYPNTNKSVIKDIDPEAKKFIATEPANLEGLTVQDDQWWLDNGPDTEERYAEWLGE